MDLIKAIQFGLLVKAAEAVDPGNTTNSAGQILNISYGAIHIDYKVVTTVYANDLATDINPGRVNKIVSFGFVLQALNNDVVIAVRGTEGIWEWIQDARFLAVKCPFLPGAGLTEDGFTAIYNSLRVDVNPASARVVNALATLPFQQPVGSMTICGHSLGGAIATLFALDVAANSSFKHPTAYTYASPRTGDPMFASTYNQVVPDTFRIANRVDIVPQLPVPPLYEHVAGEYDLNPIKLGLPPKVLVKFNPLCEHHLTTYLHLLSLPTGGPVLPLNPECIP